MCFFQVFGDDYSMLVKDAPKYEGKLLEVAWFRVYKEMLWARRLRYMAVGCLNSLVRKAHEDYETEQAMRKHEWSEITSLGSEPFGFCNPGEIHKVGVWLKCLASIFTLCKGLKDSKQLVVLVMTVFQTWDESDFCMHVGCGLLCLTFY